MEGHRWSCLWGLLCITADAFVSAVFQEPSSVTWVKVNTSVEISCSKSIDKLKGVSLFRGVQNTTQLVYLNVEDGKITKTTTRDSIKPRMELIQEKRDEDDYGFTWRLSLVRLDDTDWYYCSWRKKTSREMKDELGYGTTVIVTETGPPEECHNSKWKSRLGLTFAAITLTLFLLIVALIVRYKQHQRGYTITRVAGQAQCTQHQHVCARQGHKPYMVI